MLKNFHFVVVMRLQIYAENSNKAMEKAIMEIKGIKNDTSGRLMSFFIDEIRVLSYYLESGIGESFADYLDVFSVSGFHDKPQVTAYDGGVHTVAFVGH